MQSNHRQQARPGHGNYRGIRSRINARKRNRRKAIAATTFIAILIVFAVIRSYSKLTAYIWMFVSFMIWAGILIAIYQQTTAGKITKIEIVNTAPRGRSSIVLFRETTESGMARMVQHEAGSAGYNAEIALMNVLENSTANRTR